MTLTEVLLGIGFCTPVCAAIETAKDLHSNVLGYAVCVVIGLLMGLAVAKIIWILHRWAAHIESGSDRLRTKPMLIAVPILLVDFLWIACVGAVSAMTSSFLLHTLK